MRILIMKNCPNCGFQLNGYEKRCPNCGYDLEGYKEENVEGINSEISEPEKPQIPFSDTSQPFFDRLFLTMKLVLLSPSEFFSTYNFKSQIGSGLLFAVIMGQISGIFSFLYNLILRGSMFILLSKWAHIPQRAMVTQGILSVVGGLFGIIFIPIGVIIGVFITSGVYHLLLMVVNGAKNRFEATINVVSYNTAVLIFSIVPFCGNIIGYIYRIILDIIGLSKVHETSTGKAAFAVLLPILFCCVCVFLIYILIVAGIIGIAAGLQHIH